MEQGAVGSVGAKIKKDNVAAATGGQEEEAEVGEVLNQLRGGLKNLNNHNFEDWADRIASSSPSSSSGQNPVMVLDENNKPVSPKPFSESGVSVDNRASVRSFSSSQENEKQQKEDDRKENLDNLDEQEMERLRSIYPKKSLEIAISWWESIGAVLLDPSKHFVYKFDEEVTKVPGLSFEFRSLTAGEDYEIKNKMRFNGWDRDMTGVSYSLDMYEKLSYSLIEYCGKDLSSFSPERKQNFMKDIEQCALRSMMDCLEYFNLALNLVSMGEEHLDLVKKSLAPQLT